MVLYPQTIKSSSNPEACWDFWGYDSPDFADEDRTADGDGSCDDRWPRQLMRG